jgi:hypothetical protein
MAFKDAAAQSVDAQSDSVTTVKEG